MEARYLALLLLVPFIFVFAYATWHEYKRFKAEGRSTYGLSYDPDTNTTHVSPIPEDEKSFDLDDYDPDLLETEAKEQEETDDSEDVTPKEDEDVKYASDTDHRDTDDKPQDSRI